MFQHANPSPTSSSDELLRTHDSQVRGTVHRRLLPDWSADADGPVLRVRTGHRGLAFSDGLLDLRRDEVEKLVAAAVTYFRRHRQQFEWKVYSNDHEHLVETLKMHGFSPEPTETVLLGEASSLTRAGEAPTEVRVRKVDQLEDLERVAGLETEVWGQDWSWLGADLAARLDSSPDDVGVWIAEADHRAVSAAWLVRLPGTDIAGLWGGATLPEWRRRGIYKALVATRARAAEQLRARYLWVDASDDSRPILERLGMTAVATTTPWISPI